MNQCPVATTLVFGRLGKDCLLCTVSADASLTRLYGTREGIEGKAMLFRGSSIPHIGAYAFLIHP